MRSPLTTGRSPVCFPKERSPFSEPCDRKEFVPDLGFGWYFQLKERSKTFESSLEVTILETVENLLFFGPGCLSGRKDWKWRSKLFNVEETFLEAGVKSNSAFQFLSRQKSAELSEGYFCSEGFKIEKAEL